MSDELVIRCCAPTLAAIKTGSLFNCAFESESAMLCGLRRLNQSMRDKGIAAIPLCCRQGRTLIYLYRPAMLAMDLRDPKADALLRMLGYPEGSVSKRVAYLRQRIRESVEFPHEIGLFLGYPAADVQGFINHGVCKYTGLWKVYDSDEENARRVFRRCQNCTAAYLCRYREGWTLSRLTIQPRRLSCS